MAVITRMNGIPLFSSIQEALRWGKFNRLKGGYHIHYWEGRKGYMGGNNHSELANRRPMKFDAALAARQKARLIVSPATPVQPEQLEPLEQIIKPPVRPARTEELERPVRLVRPTIRRTTSSGGGGGGGY